MAAVVFTVDWESRERHPADPERGDRRGRGGERGRPDPVRERRPGAARTRSQRARPLIDEHGVKGFKFHPNLQAFFPNDRSAYPLYEVIAEAGLPALFHSGHSGIGTGPPGRRRASASSTRTRCASTTSPPTSRSSRSSSPTRRSRGRTRRSRSACTRRTSGSTSPAGRRSTSRRSSSSTRTRSSRREVLFGSDFPLITPDRWLADFEQAPFKDEVRPLILKENAARLLGLDDRKEHDR